MAAGLVGRGLRSRAQNACNPTREQECKDMGKAQALVATNAQVGKPLETVFSVLGRRNTALKRRCQWNGSPIRAGVKR